MSGPPANNGNISTIINNLTDSRTQNFTYDNLNRISSAETTVWGNGYGYDNWGNLLSKNAISGLTQPENLSVQVNGNNQITSASGVSYDAAGEMTVDNLGNHFAYDGEGRILTVNTPSNSYVYDGSGYRVKKTTSSGTTLYWPGADGRILNESNSTASSFGRQVYLNGLMIWHEDTTGAGLFLFQDHLGSVRVTADASGNVKDDIDYLPFGAIYNNYVSPGSDNHYQFTETEKDSESSSSYMMYRNLSWSLARWNRPDPWGGSYDLSKPQSLNRYSYVMNRPLVLIDPSGLDAVCLNGDPDGDGGPCDGSGDGGVGGFDPGYSGWGSGLGGDFTGTDLAEGPDPMRKKGSFIDNHPCLIPAGVALGVDIGALFFEPLAPWAVSYSAHAFACEFIF